MQYSSSLGIVSWSENLTILVGANRGNRSGCVYKRYSYPINVDIRCVIVFSFNAKVHTTIIHAFDIECAFVDFRRFWQLSICLQVSGFIGGIFENDIALFVLVIPKREEDNVALVYPNL
ncbi:uncharacterized protein DFL_001823 [Arthrobotrys flagrans]|uniref:Uncharacterized protein n=1 Tax=Arthrobotrys flagrans TaxID=97331 RepID=A0A437A8Q7_ARTFL|nr:hypothetical protein DFL_001823 [Arthrobotrys flagrans]